MPLPGESVEPLRAAFNAQDATPLKKAVLAELAQSYLDDLDYRKVRGDEARAVLRDIIQRSGELDANARCAARHLSACFSSVHDDTGALRRRMSEMEVCHLERRLAKVPPAILPELRSMLLALLFDGETARLKLDIGDEARLYRVLTGIEQPTHRQYLGGWIGELIELELKHAEALDEKRHAARVVAEQ